MWLNLYGLQALRHKLKKGQTMHFLATKSQPKEGDPLNFHVNKECVCMWVGGVGGLCKISTLVYSRVLGVKIGPLIFFVTSIFF